MLSEEIELGRCLCIHAQLQAIDTVLQGLLYQRGIVPFVVSQLLQLPESPHEIKFVEAYAKIREGLRQLFRSCNRRSIHEIIVVIGSSCSFPQEVYRIPINVCDTHESDSAHCGENCGELSPREQRRLSSTLVISQNLNGPRKVTQNTRVYVLARGNSKLQFPEELVEIDEGFTLPESEVMARRKIFSMRFNLKHICVENVIATKDPETICFRLSSFIRAFN